MSLSKKKGEALPEQQPLLDEPVGGRLILCLVLLYENEIVPLYL
jgi:hypothetical protein